MFLWLPCDFVIWQPFNILGKLRRLSCVAERQKMYEMLTVSVLVIYQVTS